MGFCARFLAFAGLIAITALAQPGSQAKAANRYFDRNGAIFGFGVADGGFYSWESSFWNNNDPNGTTATSAWTENDAPIFPGSASYTVTAGASHSIAGLGFVNKAFKTLSINSSGGSVLTLTSSALGQSVTAPSALVVNASLASDTITPLLWNGEGTLSLYGNNSALKGGIVVNTSYELRFNNANSLGTGPITFGGGASDYEITSGASFQTMTFNNAVTGPARSGADATLSYTGDHPVTFTNWTLGTGGTNTIALGNNTYRNPVLTIGDGTIGIKGDANSALTVTVASPINGSAEYGTLVVNGASTYSGNTTIGGAEVALGYPTLQANDGVGLPTSSFLTLNGGVLQANGSFTRSLASSGASNFKWNSNGGGFSAIGNQLTVNLGGSGSELAWGGNIGSQIVGPLKFGSISANAKTLFVNGIDLNNSGAAATRTVNVAAGVGNDSAEIAGVIRATGGAGTNLQKDGTGTLILSAANTYVGTTTISGGALQAIDGAGLPTASFLALDGGVFQGNGSFTRSLSPGGASHLEWTAKGGGFSANGGTFNVNIGGASAPLVWGSNVGSQIVGGLVFGSNTANAKTVFVNVIDMNNTAAAATRTITVNKGTGGDLAEVSGVLSNSGTGVASLTKNGEGTLLLSNANTYSGGTTVSAGTLAVGNDNALGSGGLVLIGGTIAASGSRKIANNVVLTSLGEIGGADSLTFNGTLTCTSFAPSLIPNTLVISNTGGTTFNQAVYMSDAATSGGILVIKGSGNVTFNGPIQNNNVGPGLSGTISFASYTGTATINGANTYTGLTNVGGTFVLGNKAAFGTSTIAMNGATISASVDLSGASAIANTTVNLNSNNVFHGANSLEFTGTVTATASRIITNSLSSGSLKLSGPVKLSNSAVNNTLTITGNGNTTIGGPISNGGTSTASGLSIDGSGIVTVSGTNTYTGSTNVNGGTLLVNGSIISAVSVGPGGKLGGTGAIGGEVTNAGRIAPGTGVGTLTLESDLVMSTDSILAVDVNGPTADLLVVGGDLDLSAVQSLDVTGSGAGPWVVATYAGTLTGSFDYVTPGFVADYSTIGQISLSPVAIAGDYNNDGVVDAADFVVWRKSPVRHEAEYSTWRTNYGRSLSDAAAHEGDAAPVPEPAALVILSVGLVALACGRQSRTF